MDENHFIPILSPYTFDIAPKYSCIPTIAISVNNSPVIILYGINNITIKTSPTINPDVILLKSIFFVLSLAPLIH